MTITPLVYAITLSWNRCQDTVACLASLSQLDYPNLRLLLVDNGSTDGTPDTVAQNFSHVQIIINEKNLGFAGGCNVGLQHALSQNADYILLLNNDTEIDSMALRYMLDQTRPDVGMIAPKIYYHADPTRIWSIGGECHSLTIEKTHDACGQLDIGQWNAVLEREYFVGCTLLFSRQFLTEVGLFDERFFMYYEDSDLSLRARQAGFKLLLTPQAHVWHKVAVSSGGSDSPNERYWMARSSILFFHKHISGWRWFIIIPYRTGSAIKTILRLLWHRRYGSMKAYMKGLHHGLVEVKRAA